MKSHVLACIAVAAACLAGCMTNRTQASGPIHEAGWVTLGGVEQWVTIRGDDLDNPVLLHVHGGPGFSLSAFTEEFAPYEADFTVIHWDQRGAGRTFGRYGEDTPDWTLERIAQDGIELAGYLRDRLGDRPIIVFGHSLGTLVGVDMVRRAPGRFTAYVGASQFVSFQGNLDGQLVYLRGIADAEGDADLVARLDEIGRPDPASLEDFFAVNRLLNAHLTADDVAFFTRLQARAPEAMTPEELADWNAGRQASAGALMPQTVGLNLFGSAQRFELPVAFIHGGDDIFTPSAPMAAYFESLEAPQKALVILDGAGHFPFMTHTDAFLAALKEEVLPMVEER